MGTNTGDFYGKESIYDLVSDEIFTAIEDGLITLEMFQDWLRCYRDKVKTSAYEEGFIDGKFYGEASS